MFNHFRCFGLFGAFMAGLAAPAAHAGDTAAQSRTAAAPTQPATSVAEADARNLRAQILMHQAGGATMMLRPPVAVIAPENPVRVALRTRSAS